VKGNFDRRLAALEARLLVSDEHRGRFIRELSDLHLEALCGLFDRIAITEASQQPGLYALVDDAMDQLAMGIPWREAVSPVYEALNGPAGRKL
jgi:hypothetical protein